MNNDIFRPPQIPRRCKPTKAPIQLAATPFLIEGPGLPPEVLQLEPALARLLVQLAEAGETGLLNTDPKLSGRISKLRSRGVLIETTREPRSDGGAGWLARWRLACDVQRLREGD